MTKEASANTASPLILKLTAYKESHRQDVSFTLPGCGVVATFPGFIPHSAWMKAQRLAKRDMNRAQIIYLVQVCTFDGEKLTVQEFTDLIPSADAFELMGEVMGDDSEDGEALGKSLAH